MAAGELAPNSPYAGKVVILNSNEAKSIAIGPPLWERLRMSTLEYVSNWGEDNSSIYDVYREEDLVSLARQQCDVVIERLGNKAEYIIATEGAILQDSTMPSPRQHLEVIYFIDRPHGFHLHLSRSSTITNYERGEMNSLEDLFAFAKRVQFPSQSLLIGPNGSSNVDASLMQVNHYDDLVGAFIASMKLSPVQSVWVETDMRAWANPSRMQVIRELSASLALQLSKLAIPSEI